MHYSEGEVYDDIQDRLICTECGQEVEEVKLFGADDDEHILNISKDMALLLLKRPEFLVPGCLVMCFEYGKFDPAEGTENDWVGVTSDDLETLADPEYKSFALWYDPVWSRDE